MLLLRCDDGNDVSAVRARGRMMMMIVKAGTLSRRKENDGGCVHRYASLLLPLLCTLSLALHCTRLGSQQQHCDGFSRATSLMRDRYNSSLVMRMYVASDKKEEKARVLTKPPVPTLDGGIE